MYSNGTVDQRRNSITASFLKRCAIHTKTMNELERTRTKTPRVRWNEQFNNRLFFERDVQYILKNKARAVLLIQQSNVRPKIENREKRCGKRGKSHKKLGKHYVKHEETYFGRDGNM